MKESKQVRSEHQSFVDAWNKINEHTNSTLVKEAPEVPVVLELPVETVPVCFPTVNGESDVTVPDTLLFT